MATSTAPVGYGKEIRDSYEKVSLEDRIAQMVMAVCYTTRHIDVAVHEARTQAVLTEEQEDQLLKVKNQSKRGDQKKTLLTAAQGILDAPPLARLATKKEEWESAFEGGFKGSGGFTRQEFLDQGTSIVMRNQKQPTPKGNMMVALDVSEINFDTTAVIVHEKTLYIAFNFKMRARQDVAMEYEAVYSNVGTVAWSGTIDRIQAALNSELGDGRGDPDLEKVVYVKVETVKAKKGAKPEEENAAPHAEMQLLTQLNSLSISPEGLRLGCSKQCCKMCAEVLDDKKVIFSDRHNNTVRNWAKPITEITTAAERTYPVKWFTSDLT